MVFKQAPTLDDALSLSIECADCGHSRWRRAEEFRSMKIGPQTPIQEVAAKLFCAPCRREGLPGKNISVQVAFASEEQRRDAEKWSKLRNQTVRAAG